METAGTAKAWERGKGWGTHVEPLTRAILDLVCTLETNWTDVASVQLTSTEERALHLLWMAGLVEHRIRIVATHGREALTIQAVASGEGVDQEVLRVIAARAPHWCDEQGVLRGAIDIQTSIGSVRLSDQGEEARHLYLHPVPDEPAYICAFVRKLGPFAARPPVAPLVRVEAFSMGAAADQPPGAVAMAAASASVGDIAIENKVHVDTEAIAAALRPFVEQLATRAASSSGQIASASRQGAADPLLGALTEAEAAVLRALAKSRGRRMLPEHIQAADPAPAEPKRLRRVLRSLHDRGLVDYPKGTRDGVCITPRGEEAFNEWERG